MLQFYPGWTLTIDGRSGEIFRVNRRMRGAAVGAGTHRIAYRHDPVPFRVGKNVSLSGHEGPRRARALEPPSHHG
ncbi:MAG: hypothetical protein JO034_16895 [Singulisphaera sp.]|nr:hypothetical protein [Singulisphaera sp.]